MPKLGGEMRSKLVVVLFIVAMLIAACAQPAAQPTQAPAAAAARYFRTRANCRAGYCRSRTDHGAVDGRS